MLKLITGGFELICGCIGFRKLPENAASDKLSSAKSLFMTEAIWRNLTTSTGEQHWMNRTVGLKSFYSIVVGGDQEMRHGLTNCASHCFGMRAITRVGWVQLCTRSLVQTWRSNRQKLEGHRKL
jgi:hypothetical protein